MVRGNDARLASESPARAGRIQRLSPALAHLGALELLLLSGNPVLGMVPLTAIHAGEEAITQWVQRWAAQQARGARRAHTHSNKRSLTQQFRDARAGTCTRAHTPHVYTYAHTHGRGWECWPQTASASATDCGSGDLLGVHSSGDDLDCNSL